ncbi:MAG TPA: hypothetical protein VF384_15885 [Planctomycetota bacterium]
MRHHLAAVLLFTLPLDAQCALQWLPNPGTAGTIRALATLPGGDEIAGGSFTMLGGVPAANVARRAGGAWAALGSGTNGTVLSLAVLPSGDLVAGGTFTVAGGVPANGIARWNGTAWAPLGTGVSGSLSVQITTGVQALLVLPNGDLLAGGHFVNAGAVVANHVARWDGAAWHDLAGGVASSHLNALPEIKALERLPNGDVVAAGSFVFAGGVIASRIARWNGTSWSAMDAGWPFSQTPVRRLLLLPNGTLLAAGAYPPPLGPGVPLLASWSGAAWTQFGGALASAGTLGDGAIDALTVLPDGDVVVGGHAVAVGAGGAGNQLLRSNGATWTSLGTVAGDLHALQWSAGGRLLAGGTFASVGGIVAPGFAELATTCPTVIGSVGSGCTGSAGPKLLSATSPPWLGGTFVAEATGMPALSIALAITSTSPATIPLAAVLPVGGPGCDGLVSPFLSTLLLPAGGLAVSVLPLPDAPSLAGVVLHHYVANLEFDTTGAIVALTATPRLQLTLGSF